MYPHTYSLPGNSILNALNTMSGRFHTTAGGAEQLAQLLRFFIKEEPLPTMEHLEPWDRACTRWKHFQHAAIQVLGPMAGLSMLGARSNLFPSTVCFRAMLGQAVFELDQQKLKVTVDKIRDAQIADQLQRAVRSAGVATTQKALDNFVKVMKPHMPGAYILNTKGKKQFFNNKRGKR